MKIPETWTFEDEEVARKFDEHVVEQLPFYPFVTRAVAHVAAHYLSREGTVYDVGASTGNVGRELAPVLLARGAHLISVEPSAEMSALWRGPGELVRKAAEDVEWVEHDASVFMLTLMFLPPDCRKAVLARAWEKLRVGGVMIVVDRTPAASGYPATVLWRLTLAEKLRAGAVPGDVLAKELSLAGVQRPLDVSCLPGSPVEFFRFGDFAAWLTEKL